LKRLQFHVEMIRFIVFYFLSTFRCPGVSHFTQSSTCCQDAVRAGRQEGPLVFKQSFHPPSCCQRWGQGAIYSIWTVTSGWTNRTLATHRHRRDKFINGLFTSRILEIDTAGSIASAFRATNWRVRQLALSAMDSVRTYFT